MYILCKCYSIYGIPVIVYYVVYVTWKPAIKSLYIGMVFTLLNWFVVGHWPDWIVSCDCTEWVEMVMMSCWEGICAFGWEKGHNDQSLLYGVSQEEIWITAWSQDRMDCFHFFYVRKDFTTCIDIWSGWRQVNIDSGVAWCLPDTKPLPEWVRRDVLKISMKPYVVPKMFKLLHYKCMFYSWQVVVW